MGLFWSGLCVRFLGSPPVVLGTVGTAAGVKLGAPAAQR